MSKRYVHTVDNAAATDAATFKTLVADENPLSYPVGALYVLLNGVMLIVTANDGTSVTIGTITVT